MRRVAATSGCALALLFPCAAHAQENPERAEALVGAGISFRHWSKIDLAKQAGASGYGSGNDASPGALGFDIRGGLLFPFDLEIDGYASIAVGGLALSNVERRYFASSGQLGGGGVAAAGLSPRYAPMLITDLRLLVGPSVTFERMFANSEVGSATLDLIAVGLDAGARYRINRIGSVADGHIELVFSVRREFPYATRVARSGADVLFSGAGGGDPIYSFGTVVSYVFGFHRIHRR